MSVNNQLLPVCLFFKTKFYGYCDYSIGFYQVTNGLKVNG